MEQIQSQLIQKDEEIARLNSLLEEKEVKKYQFLIKCPYLNEHRRAQYRFPMFLTSTRCLILLLEDLRSLIKIGMINEMKHLLLIYY